jgi:hypothetical protein
MSNGNTSKRSSSGKSQLDYSSLNRAYREVKRNLLTKASDQDLLNLIIMLNQYAGKDLPEHLAKVVTAFAVSAISEEGAKRQRNKPKCITEKQ